MLPCSCAVSLQQPPPASCPALQSSLSYHPPTVHNNLPPLASVIPSRPLPFFSTLSLGHPLPHRSTASHPENNFSQAWTAPFPMLTRVWPQSLHCTLSLHIRNSSLASGHGPWQSVRTTRNPHLSPAVESPRHHLPSLMTFAIVTEAT